MVVKLDLHPGAYVYLVENHEWSTARDDRLSVVEGKFDRVFITLTETDSCRDRVDCVNVLRALRTKHTESGLPEIKHNFMISDNGDIYEGRGWTYLPHVYLEKKNVDNTFDKHLSKQDYEKQEFRYWLAGTVNTLQIAYIGSLCDGPGSAKMPTDEMVQAAMSLVKYGMKIGLVSTSYKLDFYAPYKKDSMRFFRL